MPLNAEQYNEEATADTIRHYALGIGDDNPLWLDDDYARTTPFGCRIAPPTFVYSVFDANAIRGLPEGILPMHITAELDFHTPIRIKDAINAETRIVSVDERHSARAGLMAVQTAESTYRNQHGTLVAVARQMLAAVANSGIGAYTPRPQHTYTDDELEAIRRDVLAEARRGAEPRHWEDVNEGDTIPAVVKGPIDVISQICYYAGAVGSAALDRGVEIRWKGQEEMRRKADPRSVLDPWRLDAIPGTGHRKDDPMQTAPPHDNGNQRTAWCAHLLTNWAGDSGTLRSLRVEIRRPTVYGDTLWIRGTVIARRDDGGEGVVDVDITGTNQLGEETTRGRAVVALPRRAG